MSNIGEKKLHGGFKRFSGFVQRAFANNIAQHVSPDIPSDNLLSSWGVPDSVCVGFKSLGISSLYRWQEECLRKICQGLVAFEGCVGSAIYSAPTSGGKSLVADLIMFRRLYYEGCRALVVCPFVSICRERALFLRQVFGPLGIVVKEFHGPLSSGWNEGVDIAVCTVQKATSILHTSLIASHVIGTVIVDEFHLAFSTSSMESFVTKLGLLKDREKIFLLGMSATLPAGVESEMLNWLNSHSSVPCITYSCDYRPIGLSLFTKRGQNLREIFPKNEVIPITRIFPSTIDQDLFGSLCFHKCVPTIVFCATRNWCEKAVKMLTSMSNITERCLGRVEMVEALSLLSPCGVQPVLNASILAGIAFHHAGLTNEERAVIELGFRNGVIWLLCATSTISAGVNLPAARVILRTLSAASGGTAVSSVAEVEAKLKQMVGRAGRTGISSHGEAIVMCQSEKEEKIVCEVFSKTTQHEVPKLLPIDIKQIGKEILEIVIFFKKSSLDFFTTIFSEKKFGRPQNIHSAIEFLISAKLIALLEGSVIVPTAVGEALAYSAMSPEEAESTYAQLCLARNRLCLSGGDLHLLFLVCPPVTLSDLELNNFASSPLGRHSLQEAASLLGVASSKKIMAALILRDLITEYNLAQVAAKFGVSSGTVQYLQSNAATYCAMVSAFCEKLQWTSLAAALNSVKPRLHFGVPADLVSLMDIEGVSAARARALAAAGFKTIEAIAEAETLDLAIAITRDVSVEGTQMTSNKTAKRLMEITCKTMRQDARSKLGLFDEWEKTFPPVSPPLLHQLMSTQMSTMEDSDTDEILALFQSPTKSVKRISEMTTINGKRSRVSNEFGLPPNKTQDDEIEFNSSLLRAIDEHA